MKKPIKINIRFNRWGNYYAWKNGNSFIRSSLAGLIEDLEKEIGQVVVVGQYANSAKAIQDRWREIEAACPKESL